MRALIVALVMLATPVMASEDPEKYYCGRRTSLAQCADEIIRLAREQAPEPRGSTRNWGMSSGGCVVTCEARHFPTGTPQECAASRETFQRLARQKPYLLRTRTLDIIDEKCGQI